MESFIRFNAVAFSLAIPALISGGLAVYSFTRRPVFGSRVFALLMLALCVWAVFYGVELSCLTLDGMLACAAIEYLGIATLPVLWLILTLLYTGREKWVTRRNTILLFVIPFITIVMVATSRWHNYYYSTTGVDISGPFPEIELTRGPWYWVHTVYSYSALLAVTFFLIKNLGKAQTLFRSQVIAMLAGMSVPWAVSILYVGFGLMIFGRVDPTPFAFTITGMVIAWSMFRYGLFDILPVAYDTIVESMDTAIIVTDVQDRIVAYNRSADKIFNLSRAGIGQSASIIWKDQPELMNLVRSEGPARIEMELGLQDSVSCYEASTYNLADRHRQVIGRVTSLHDITGRKQSEQALRDNEAALTSMFNIVGTGIMVIDSEKHTILEINQTAATMIGLVKEEIVGRVCHSFICPAETGKCPIKDLGQTIDNSERKIICAGGHQRNIVKSVTPFIFRGRHCYLESFIDITERKRAEENLKQVTDRLSLAARAGGVGIWDYDTVNNILVWDDVMYRLYGITPDSFGGAYEAWKQGLHPDDVQRGDAEILMALSGEKEFNTEFRVVWPDGNVRNIRALAIVQRDAAGKPTHMVGTNWDITEIKRAEEALRQSEEKFRLLIENANDMVWTLNSDMKITYVSPSVRKLLGYEPEMLIGKAVKEVMKPEVLQSATQTVEVNQPAIEEGADRSVRIERQWYRVDGSLIWVETVARALYDQAGRHTGFIGVTRDITERKQMQQKLEEMATHDYLTGLPNRVLLLDRFTIAAALAQRNKVRLAVMSLDLDKFKSINDTMGHNAGDAVLKAVSARLTGIIRGSDTLARVGGDEFILLMMETGDMRDTMATAQKILDCFAEPLTIDGHQLQLSTSVGIASYPEDARDLETLIKKSDAAMYYSKGHGRSQFKFFSDGDVRISGGHKSAA